MFVKDLEKNTKKVNHQILDRSIEELTNILVAWAKEHDTYSIHNYWYNLVNYLEVLPDELKTKIKTACQKAMEQLSVERKTSMGSYGKLKIFWSSPRLRPEVLSGMFYEYLKESGLKNSTIETHIHNIEFFFDPYLKDCAILHPLEVSNVTIEDYVGNWYIRKVQDTTPAQLMSVLTSIKKFYHMMWTQNYLDDGLYDGIKEECKNRKKFQARYESYHAIDNADSWMDWVL